MGYDTKKNESRRSGNNEQFPSIEWAEGQNNPSSVEMNYVFDVEMTNCFQIESGNLVETETMTRSGSMMMEMGM